MVSLAGLQYGGRLMPPLEEVRAGGLRCVGGEGQKVGGSWCPAPKFLLPNSTAWSALRARRRRMCC